MMRTLEEHLWAAIERAQDDGRLTDAAGHTRLVTIRDGVGPYLLIELWNPETGDQTTGQVKLTERSVVAARFLELVITEVIVKLKYSIDHGGVIEVV
jgi:hypothetical protein